MVVECVKADLNLREEFEAFEIGSVKHWNARPPLYVRDDGGNGSMQRQCTSRVKIKPLERAKLLIMGHKTARGVPDSAAVVQIGISTDEARRASASQTRWVDRSYPLIDPLKMSRSDCQSWWEKNYPHINLPSSSCVICPYKPASMWRKMKESDAQDWETAVDYDDRIRAAYEKKGQSVYVYRDRIPLRDANLNESQSAFDLEDEIYCAGGCGL